MLLRIFRRRFVMLAVLILLRGFGMAASGPIFGIATPGGQFAYTVTNTPTGTLVPGLSPTLQLSAGATYRIFVGVTGIHPVVVVTNNTGNFANPPVNFSYAQASPQNIASGTITLTLPATNYPSTLYYQCNLHSFSGVIQVLPPPPANRILSTSVTTNVVLVSSGTTNTWLFVPEYSSNLAASVWTAIPSFTNSFVNGTNVTTFSRLEPICGPQVFLRVRQSPPN